MASDFFQPTDPTSGQTSFLPGFSGLPRIPGETDAAYQTRLQQAQFAYQQANAENGQIKDLAGTESAASQKTLDAQSALQKTRLSDLASLLAQQNNQQFNRDIPGIANTAQGQGFLETSGFGNALSRDYTNLQQDTNNKLLAQGLSDRDLQIKGLGDITSNSNALQTAGLQRQFSVTDQAQANELALKLGQMGVPSPVRGPSTTDTLLQSAGPILSGVGAAKGASALPAAAGGAGAFASLLGG